MPSGSGRASGTQSCLGPSGDRRAFNPLGIATLPPAFRPDRSQGRPEPRSPETPGGAGKCELHCGLFRAENSEYKIESSINAVHKRKVLLLKTSTST